MQPAADQSVCSCGPAVQWLSEPGVRPGTRRLARDPTWRWCGPRRQPPVREHRARSATPKGRARRRRSRASPRLRPRRPPDPLSTLDRRQGRGQRRDRSPVPDVPAQALERRGSRARTRGMRPPTAGQGPARSAVCHPRTTRSARRRPSGRGIQDARQRPAPVGEWSCRGPSRRRQRQTMTPGRLTLGNGQQPSARVSTRRAPSGRAGRLLPGARQPAAVSLSIRRSGFWLVVETRASPSRCAIPWTVPKTSGTP